MVVHGINHVNRKESVMAMKKAKTPRTPQREPKTEGYPQRDGAEEPTVPVPVAALTYALTAIKSLPDMLTERRGN